MNITITMKYKGKTYVWIFKNIASCDSCALKDECYQWEDSRQVIPCIYDTHFGYWEKC